MPATFDLNCTGTALERLPALTPRVAPSPAPADVDTHERPTPHAWRLATSTSNGEQPKVRLEHDTTSTRYHRYHKVLYLRVPPHTSGSRRKQRHVYPGFTLLVSSPSPPVARLQSSEYRTHTPISHARTSISRGPPSRFIVLSIPTESSSDPDPVPGYRRSQAKPSQATTSHKPLPRIVGAFTDAYTPLRHLLPSHKVYPCATYISTSVLPHLLSACLCLAWQLRHN